MERNLNLDELKARKPPMTPYIDHSALEAKVRKLLQREGLRSVSPDCIEYLAHALEERLRNIMDQLAAISRLRAGAACIHPFAQSTGDADLLFDAASASPAISPIDIQVLFESDPRLPRYLLHYLRTELS